MKKLSPKETQFLVQLFNKTNKKISGEYRGKPIAIYGEFFNGSTRFLLTKAAKKRLQSVYRQRGWDLAMIETKYFDKASELHQDQLWFQIILINTRRCVKELRQIIDGQIKKPVAGISSHAVFGKFLSVEWNFVSSDTVYPELNRVKVLKMVRSHYERLGWKVLQLRISGNDFSVDPVLSVAIARK